MINMAGICCVVLEAVDAAVARQKLLGGDMRLKGMFPILLLL